MFLPHDHNLDIANFVSRDADLFQRRRSSARSMEQGLFVPELRNNDLTSNIAVDDDEDLFDDFNWDKLL